MKIEFTTKHIKTEIVTLTAIAKVMKKMFRQREQATPLEQRELKKIERMAKKLMSQEIKTTD